jgi:acetyl esterase/lipase
VLDFPGGGFVAMSPEHHDDRLRAWATRTGRPVLSIDYGKAPECLFIYIVFYLAESLRVYG